MNVSYLYIIIIIIYIYVDSSSCCVLDAIESLEKMKSEEVLRKWPFSHADLVGGFKHFLFSIINMGCHPSHWLSYFSEG